MILVKSFLTGASYDYFRLIHVYLNEGDKIRECYRCFKMIMQVHLHVGFFTKFFIKRASLKQFHLYINCCKLVQFLYKNNNHEGYCD